MSTRRKNAAESPESAATLPPRPEHARRMRLVFWVLLLAFLVVTLRLIELQLNPDKRFSEEDRNRLGWYAIQLPRGKILDSDGRVLAADRKSPLLSVDPSAVKDPGALAEWLAPALSLDKAYVYEQLTKLDGQGRLRKCVYIKRDLTEAELTALGDEKALRKLGLTIDREPQRTYPQGELACHVLGYVNRDGKGQEGVESFFDEYLTSAPGIVRSRRGGVPGRRGQHVLLASRVKEQEDPIGGDTVVLTIDAAIQHTLEKELSGAIADNNADWAMGIMMNPKTGAILAMASVPGFDPNLYGDAPDENRRNRPAMDYFEPGSAFKIVTASAAIEHGLVSPATMIDCEGGRFNPYGHSISDVHKFGVIPFSQCFEESSNIAIIKVAAMLGPERLYAWMRRFGFGQLTTPDLKFESAGLLRAPDKWSKLSMGSLPMGQEIGVTILQLCRAYCVIANGGYLVEPYLVEGAMNGGEVTYAHDALPPQRILSGDTAAIMRELCHRVVINGTGTYANIKEYRVGGKTGTAQVANPDTGGFYKDRYNTIFAGFAPVVEPAICGVIVVHNPRIKLHYGGYVCGPVFQRIVRESLVRMNIPADPVQENTQVAEEESDADVMGLRAQIEALEPSDEELLAASENLQLVDIHTDTREGEPGLPSFKGMTKRQAKARIDELGLQWDAQGSGWVVAQDPPPGTPLKETQLCRLQFGNRRTDANEAEGTATSTGL